QFDIFALSSKTEQMPNSVLEAMAMGLPVVSTDVGDVKHILAAENAPFVVPIGDSKSFAEAISRLLSDKVVAQSIGRANRMRAQNEFDIKTMTARYESLFFEYTSPIADSLRLKGDETAAKSPSVSRLREWHRRGYRSFVGILHHRRFPDEICPIPIASSTLSKTDEPTRLATRHSKINFGIFWQTFE